MRKWFVVLAALCASGIVLWFLGREKPHALKGDIGETRSYTLTATVATPQASQRAATDNSPGSNAVAGAAAHHSNLTAPPLPPPMLVFTNFAASTVMENMRSVFHQYAATFGGNPVGTNPEITRALNGENPKGVRFVNSEDGLRINGNGELVDPWGMPFFFHQLSGTQMEIHSAGPDRVMWTADDLVIK